MFEKISKFMDEKLSTPLAKLAEQRHLRAVRDGIFRWGTENYISPPD